MKINTAPVTQNGVCKICNAATKQANASIRDWCLSRRRIQGANSSPLMARVRNVPKFVIKPTI